jgi:hypothetical protein
MRVCVCVRSLTPVAADKDFLQVSINDPKSSDVTQFMLRMSRSFGDFPMKRIQGMTCVYVYRCVCARLCLHDCMCVCVYLCHGLRWYVCV